MDFSIINAILTDYTEEISDAISEEVINQGKKASKDLKRVSPVGKSKRQKKYAQGWTYSTEKGRNFTHVSIHNKTNYRLAHLLEDGHALRNGGRTRAFPHIKPIEQEVVKDFEGNVKLIIGRMK